MAEVHGLAPCFGCGKPLLLVSPKCPNCGWSIDDAKPNPTAAKSPSPPTASPPFQAPGVQATPPSSPSPSSPNHQYPALPTPPTFWEQMFTPYAHLRYLTELRIYQEKNGLVTTQDKETREKFMLCFYIMIGVFVVYFVVSSIIENERIHQAQDKIMQDMKNNFPASSQSPQ